MRSLVATALVALAASCASAPPPPPAPPAPPVATSTVETTRADVEACEVVCEKPKVTTTPTPDSPDVVEMVSANVDRVFASMNEDFLGCYRAALRTNPGAHAFMTIDVVIEADGHVRSVETTGGANLGNKGVRCITDRVRDATFAPVPGGGTRHIQVPLTFRRGAADDGA